MPEFTIRPAGDADASAITHILRSTGWFESMMAEPSQATESRIQHHLKLCLADHSHSVYLAEHRDGSVVGYVSAHWLPYFFLSGPEGYVSELFIEEAYRGRNIGKRLLKEVVREAKERACSRLMLVTSRSREAYRRKFYAKDGWQEREDIANFILLL